MRDGDYVLLGWLRLLGGRGIGGLERARGRSPLEVKVALLAVNEALARHGVREVKTVSSSLLAFQSELEERYGLSYFDSLIASSALTLDCQVVSDDDAFDRVPSLKRIPLSPTK